MTWSFGASHVIFISRTAVVFSCHIRRYRQKEPDTLCCSMLSFLQIEEAFVEALSFFEPVKF